MRKCKCNPSSQSAFLLITRWTIMCIFQKKTLHFAYFLHYFLELLITLMQLHPWKWRYQQCFGLSVCFNDATEESLWVWVLQRTFQKVMKTLYWLLSLSPPQNFFIAQNNLCGRKLFFRFWMFFTPRTNGWLKDSLGNQKVFFTVESLLGPLFLRV